MYTTISVLGPTAVGKTSFALKLAKQALSIKNKAKNKVVFTGVDIISADSRQVYKGLEVLSGADIPEGFKQVFPEEENQVAKTNFPFFKKQQIYIVVYTS